MSSMLETLIGGAVTRPDAKRILPVKRPLPTRPRDLLEVFMALGREASMASVFESCDLRDADPRGLTFVALSRWPTGAELAEHIPKYRMHQHLRGLLLSHEFRASLVRRICDAFPERPRLLYVRLPRCASDHFLSMADTLHAVLPANLGAWRPREGGSFITELGAYLGRFNLTKTILLTQPSLAPFTQAPVPPAPPPGPGADLPWTLNPPPCRPGDRLFTIIREPASLILSQVNAMLTALQSDPASAPTPRAPWRTTSQPLPDAADSAGWRKLGETILLAITDRNPICSALADGTAAMALAACRLSDVEIADLSRYPDWVKYQWNLEPYAPTNRSRPILTAPDLSRAGRAHLDHLIAEDRIFHARVIAELDRCDPFHPVVQGRNLTDG